MKASLTAAHRAFTLIEILIGLALLGMLTGGIFSVQRGALEVSRTVIESETRTLQVHALCELLRRNFEQMPGNARVNLQSYGGLGSGLTEIAFTDYPLAFKFPGVTAGAKTVIFRTERVGIGAQAAILYLDEEQADAWSKGGFDETKILGRITVLDDIAGLYWRFLNDQTQEYEEEWPLTNTRRPTTVEMTLQFMDGTDPVQLIFWIPTMMNPQQFTSGFNNQNPGGPGQPGTGPPGGGPGRGEGGRPGRGEGGRPGRGEGGRPGRDAGASIEFMRPVQGGGPGRGGPGGGRGNR